MSSAPPAHSWVLGWPGNFCTRCGLDDPVEVSLGCPQCYVPCSPEDEERDPQPRVCAECQPRWDAAKAPCPAQET
jgi:hypothetical protein